MDELILLLEDDSDESGGYTPGVDRWALEDGAGLWLLEDGAGFWLLE